jgi:hypothetical protein
MAAVGNSAERGEQRLISQGIVMAAGAGAGAAGAIKYMAGDETHPEIDEYFKSKYEEVTREYLETKDVDICRFADSAGEFLKGRSSNLSHIIRKEDPDEKEEDVSALVKEVDGAVVAVLTFRRSLGLKGIYIKMRCSIQRGAGRELLEALQACITAVKNKRFRSIFLIPINEGLTEASGLGKQYKDLGFEPRNAGSMMLRWTPAGGGRTRRRRRRRRQKTHKRIGRFF